MLRKRLKESDIWGTDTQTEYLKMVGSALQQQQEQRLDGSKSEKQ